MCTCCSQQLYCSIEVDLMKCCRMSDWRSVSITDPRSASMRMSRSENTLFLPVSLGSNCGNLQRGIWHFSCICLEWDVTLNSHTLCTKVRAFPPPHSETQPAISTNACGWFLLCPFCVCVCRSTSTYATLSIFLPVGYCVILVHFCIFAFLPVECLLHFDSFVRRVK